MPLKKYFFLAFVLFGFPAFSQIEPDLSLFKKFYKLGKNEEIFVPLGKIAFADTVVAFDPGDPWARPPFHDPKNIVGEPDYTTWRTKDPKYVSIGCGGSLTIKFTDNGFIDIEGPDLVFFEVGPSIEPFRLQISVDGQKWYTLGHVEGGKSTVDIAQFIRPVDPPRVYYYIRITDLKFVCGGPTPGSDIDAIGAIGAVIKLSLDAKVLFDTDKYSLREQARKSIKDLARKILAIPKAKIVINGYTDSDGDYDYNMILGQNRAISVRQYLKNLIDERGDYTFKIESFGESQPFEKNTTPEGKQQNRRVEIIVFPSKDFYKPPQKKSK